MAIQKIEPKGAKPVIDIGSIKVLRYYNSNKSGNTFYVHGVVLNMATKQTDVIYVNGSEGVPMTLPREMFEKNFSLA